MKTTLLVLVLAGAPALIAESPRDLTFRGSKIEFSSQSLAPRPAPAPLKLQSGELSLGPSRNVVAPAGSNDLLAPRETRRQVITRIRAVSPATPSRGASPSVRQISPGPTAPTDLIGTRADLDRIIRDVKISDAPPAQPRL